MLPEQITKLDWESNRKYLGQIVSQSFSLVLSSLWSPEQDKKKFTTLQVTDFPGAVLSLCLEYANELERSVSEFFVFVPCRTKKIV